MADQKPKTPKKPKPAKPRQYTAADLSFDFGLNVKAGKARKWKPAGGGSVQ